MNIVETPAVILNRSNSLLRNFRFLATFLSVFAFAVVSAAQGRRVSLIFVPSSTNDQEQTRGNFANQNEVIRIADILNFRSGGSVTFTPVFAATADEANSIALNSIGIECIFLSEGDFSRGADGSWAFAGRVINSDGSTTSIDLISSAFEFQFYCGVRGDDLIITSDYILFCLEKEFGLSSSIDPLSTPILKDPNTRETYTLNDFLRWGYYFEALGLCHDSLLAMSYALGLISADEFFRRVDMMRQMGF